MFKSLATVLLTLILCPIAQAQSKNDIGRRKEMVKMIVDQFQGEAVSRFGEHITLSFNDSTTLQAIGGWDDKGKIVIIVYGGIIDLDASLIPFVICHELGHILGEVSFMDIPPKHRPRSLDIRNNVEGEADYFGGRCLARFFDHHEKQNEIAVNLARTFFEKIYERSITWKTAVKRRYRGINPSYPDPDCRLLSVMSGTYDKPRPTCWYNPKK